MTDNPYSVSVQRSQYNPIQSTQVSVTDICHCLSDSLSYIPIQALGGVGHELQPNGPLLGVDSAGHYAAMNYINAPPPTRYYDDLPHLTRVGVRLQPFMSPSLTEALPKGPGEQGNRSQHQLDGHRLPEAIRYTPVIPVRVLNLPFPHSLSSHAYTTSLTEPLTAGGAPQAVLPSHVSFPHNIAGLFQGNPNIVHSGTSVDEDLKSIASRYVHNPGSCRQASGEAEPIGYCQGVDLARDRRYDVGFQIELRVCRGH